MNQKEADQDVADEVSEEVDSRGEVIKTTGNFQGEADWWVSKGDKRCGWRTI